MKNSSFKSFFKSTLLFIVFQFNFAFAQNDPAGKSYTALISTSCKELPNGGCTIRNYCKLTFKKKEVAISYFAKADCIPKNAEKFYEENAKKDKKSALWSVQNAMITIKNFNDFGSLSLAENGLTGKKEVNGKAEDLLFVKLKK